MNPIVDRSAKWLLIFSAFLFALIPGAGVHAAKFISGEEKVVSEPVNDNLYMAARSVTINAMIFGDLSVAAELISVQDSVKGDLHAAGKEVQVNTPLGDDARIFGENVRVLGNVSGDLIVFAASFYLDRNVTVEGDLVVFGSNVNIEGRVMGDVIVYGEEVLLKGNIDGSLDVKAAHLAINGRVGGKSKLAAEEIALHNDARFGNDVAYWQEDERVDFTAYMINGVAMYDEELAMYDEDADWAYLGMGAVVFWILYSLSVILVIILTVFLFHALFTKAGEMINRSFARNLGYGALYFVGLLLVGLLACFTVIGIPVGVVLLITWVLSVLFAVTITSVVLAYGLRARYSKNWGKWMVILVAVLLYPVLATLIAIPFIGWLFGLIIVCVAFGALIASRLPGKGRTAVAN